MENERYKSRFQEQACGCVAFDGKIIAPCCHWETTPRNTFIHQIQYVVRSINVWNNLPDKDNDAIRKKLEDVVTDLTSENDSEDSDNAARKAIADDDSVHAVEPKEKEEDGSK